MHADTAKRSCADDWSVCTGVPSRAATTSSSTWRGKVRAKGATPAGASDTGAKSGTRASAQHAHDPRGPGAHQVYTRDGRGIVGYSNMNMRPLPALLRLPQPPLPAHPQPAQRRSPDLGRHRRDLSHPAGHGALRFLLSADEAGMAHDALLPSGARGTPGPASPKTDVEIVARGIALAASADRVPYARRVDHGENGAEGSAGAQGTADRPPRGEEARGAPESGGEETAAAVADAAVNAHAPDASAQGGSSTQPGQVPTSTQARSAAAFPEGGETVRARSGIQAHLRRDAPTHAVEVPQAAQNSSRPYPCC
ncbi:unnamed protein product [Closterium sp. Yama58-4]|nr:unnamed protein product [Closterium sp. Yama58-4]